MMYSTHVSLYMLSFQESEKIYKITTKNVVFIKEDKSKVEDSATRLAPRRGIHYTQITGGMKLVSVKLKSYVVWV